ncbi:MAG: Imm74 family immunity protein [Methylovirgula sp.]
MSENGAPARRGRARLTVALTEAAFRVTYGKKTLTIFPAPDLPEAETPADFVIRLDELLTWDPPHQDCEIEIEDLQKIVEAISEECERRGLVVEFE